MKSFLGIIIACGISININAAETEYVPPVAGVKPDQRPAGAPVIKQFRMNRAWYDKAMTGLQPPFPSSFNFLDYQENWSNPFIEPGMVGKYDIREWHKKGTDGLNYERARWHPIHFKPAIDSATNEQCLKCHQDILERKVKKQSPAGVKTKNTLAWYQTLEVYEGEQETFHRRHLVTPIAKKLMNLQCNFCHQGNDPREESANSSTRGNFTLRKMVNTETTCLRCHGKNNYKIMGLITPWSKNHQQFKPLGGCLFCHKNIRTNRHQVTYLNAEAIEKAGKENSDTCYGCHGGRQWYRISYPYPRNPWPGQASTVPEWAKDRPTESETRYQNK